MENKYHDVPLLSPRCIRIIHLEASSHPGSPLRCHLKVISLDNYSEHDAEYTALSYAWDAQTRSCEIECDGRILLVTENCEAALRRLRHSEAAQTLWIDSICINQSKDAIEERNQQVKMMGEVYKNASRVVVWVGESDSPTDTALQRLMEIGVLSDSPDYENRRPLQQELRERFQRVLSHVTNEDDDPIGPLFKRSWFHRMWTIQEVTLSLIDRVFLCCGGLIVPWSQLILAVDVLGTEKYRWGGWREAMRLLKQFSIYLGAIRYVGVREILDDNPGDIHNNPLAFSILTNAREKVSSDPKDKIFALHGVLDELNIPFPAPDYHQSVGDIYRNSVIACVNYDKSLYVLYHVPSDNRRDDLASWVPDWSDPGWKESDPRYSVLRNRFAACKHANSRWRFSEDQNQLIVTGRIIDSIIYRAEPLTVVDNVFRYARDGSLIRRMQDPAFKDEICPFTHSTYSVLRAWVEISQRFDYPTGESTKEALKRTLVNDNPRALADPAIGRGFDSWYNLMADSELEVMEAVQIPEVERAFTALESASATVFHFHAASFSHRKCFFSTENRYFGTAPDPLPTPVEAGDQIAIVAGLEMPLLLRPVEGGYRLLTHVYFHGRMRGEAWPEREEDLQDIILV